MFTPNHFTPLKLTAQAQQNLLSDLVQLAEAYPQDKTKKTDDEVAYDFVKKS